MSSLRSLCTKWQGQELTSGPAISLHWALVTKGANPSLTTFHNSA